jgi:hypothetical protein
VDEGDAGLRGRLAEFVRYRREYLRGDEKGEAQIFSECLFLALRVLKSEVWASCSAVVAGPPPTTYETAIATTPIHTRQ